MSCLPASWCVSETRRVVMSSGGFTNSDLTCRGQIRYKYTCATSSKLGNPVLIADALEEGLDLTELPCNNCQSRHLTTNCSAHVTTLDEGPEGNNIQYLGRHSVQCPANKVSPPTCCDDCS